MIKKIEVNDRKNVNFFSSFIYNEPHVVISINSVGSDRVYFAPSQYRRDVLYLQFDDTHFHDWKMNDAVYAKSMLDYLNKNKDTFDERNKKIADHFILRLFNESQASIIKEFIDIWKDKVSLVVSQCHAGISRSSAVAAALSEYLRVGDPNDYFDSYKYLPNMYVYSVLKTILAGKEIKTTKLKQDELV